MSWFESLMLDPKSFSHSLLVFTVVISIGLYLGHLKVKGISLGATCVLFVGLLASYLGIKVDPNMISFMRNFGLILFVFFIGLQVGPSFFVTFKNGGIRLNGLMVAVIVLDMILAVVLFFTFADHISFAQILGVLFGAVTSTPGLGAAQEAIYAAGNNTDIAVGYACAYPFAILAMMLTILLLKKILKIDLEQEDLQWENEQKARNQTPIFYHILATNKALDGLMLREIREIIGRPFICSRILHDGVIRSPNANSVIHVGDKLRIVSNPEHKVAITAFCGEEDTKIDLATAHSPLISRSILVTDEKMNGNRIDDLHLSRLDGVNITRVTRAGITFFPYNSLRLQLGDVLYCVGPTNAVSRLAALMGNREKQLERPNVVAIFAGIALGIILGAIPISFPGISVPIQLGLAGGSLISAILLGYFGPRFHLVTYTTNSANLMLREWGQTFFLSAIGLGAGVQFFDAFLNGKGFLYVAMGLPISIIPMLLVGIIARRFMKCNFHTIAGLIAGSATNTALLGFVSSLSSKSTGVVAYSSVYPLAMFLRILSGQILILLFWSFIVVGS